MRNIDTHGNLNALEGIKSEHSQFFVEDIKIDCVLEGSPSINRSVRIRAALTLSGFLNSCVNWQQSPVSSQNGNQ